MHTHKYYIAHIPLNRSGAKSDIEQGSNVVLLQIHLNNATPSKQCEQLENMGKNCEKMKRKVG